MAKNSDAVGLVSKELKDNPPSILKTTAQKFGIARAKKQKVAILLSKVKRMGG